MGMDINGQKIAKYIAQWLDNKTAVKLGNEIRESAIVVPLAVYFSKMPSLHFLPERYYKMNGADSGGSSSRTDFSIYDSKSRVVGLFEAKLLRQKPPSSTRGMSTAASTYWLLRDLMRLALTDKKGVDRFLIVVCPGVWPPEGGGRHVTWKEFFDIVLVKGPKIVDFKKEAKAKPKLKKTLWHVDKNFGHNKKAATNLEGLPQKVFLKRIGFSNRKEWTVAIWEVRRKGDKLIPWRKQNFTRTR
jgi:hypothetical protein